MFDSVLWYFQTFIDATPLNNFISGIVGFNWKFDVEHITVINALTIITLQLFISNIVKNFKALPTIIFGLLFGTLGMAILAIGNTIWILLIGITFSHSENDRPSEVYFYLGTIAPPDKKATYMGFGFLYGVFRAGIGGVLGANLYVKLIDNPMLSFIKSKFTGSNLTSQIGGNINDVIALAEKNGVSKEMILNQAHSQGFWLIFAGIGVLAIISLLLYEKFIGTKRL